MHELWRHRGESQTGSGMIGYQVEALDGGIGKVDGASDEAGSAYLVVDTGPWILGHRVILPAGVIDEVDDTARTVRLKLTRDQVSSAPAVDEHGMRDADTQHALGEHYGRFFLNA
jgi:hypothetical protein